MVRHVILRVAAAFATIAAVVLVTFLLLFVVPGDPARAIAGPRATPEILDNVRRAMKLGQPIGTQFVNYVRSLLRGDLGYAYSRRATVSVLVRARVPATLALLAAGTLAQVVLGGLLGLWDGLRRARSNVLAAVNITLLSVPGFSVAFVLLLVFAYHWRIFPLTGGTGPAELVLPALSLGILGIPYYATVVSDSIEEAMRAGYIRTAVSLGYTRRQIVVRHLLRATASPMLSLTGLSVAVFFSSVVVVEQVFGWPGLGQLQIRAFTDIDRPLLMGTVIVGSVVVVLSNLAVDLVRMVVDPRVRAGR